MLSENQIKKFIDAGFKRWTKGEYDRLYIAATDIIAEDEGFQAQISRSSKFEREIEATKVYVDVKTGETVIAYGFKSFSDHKEFKALVDAIVAEAIADETVRIEDVIVDDTTITFEESPEVITGTAIDKGGKKYLVRWAILSDWDKAEIIEAADWDHPISIELQ
ncbi:hypothetical protein [Pectinatus frisingensis]|uniref:hypothetical protein n=1 Tax=Pectinatus frisingensis TaxID=865 RepID=UPI0018C534B3|nr:hypothetical protein [Pectinatus frisingensis]